MTTEQQLTPHQQEVTQQLQHLQSLVDAIRGGVDAHSGGIDDIKGDLKAGAWSIVVLFMFLAVVLWRTFGKYLTEAVEMHLQLMHSLTTSAKINAETMKKNARTLARLTSANSRVAELMATEEPSDERRRSIIKELKNASSQDVEDEY